MESVKLLHSPTPITSPKKPEAEVRMISEDGIKGGLARAIVSQPFDNFRIFMQNRNSPITMVDAFKRMMKTEGVYAFYKGVIPYAAGNVFLLSVYTNTHMQTKDEYGSFIGGALGGFYGSPLSTLVEYYRCRLFTVDKKFIWRSIPKSYVVTTARDMIGWGAFFQTYSYTKDALKDVPNPFQSIVVGSLSGIALWTSMYPLDTIKTRIQTGKYASIRQILNARNTWAGYSSCLLRAIPVNVALVYFLH